MVISGSTRLAGVIGNPVRHSMSPAIHNAAYEATGLDWAYVALPVTEDRVEAALLGAVALGLEGVSVTMPHKTAAAQFCDELTPAAARLGVVNSIRNVDGTLVGNNTDGTGFLRALLADGWSANGRRVVVVGAGGTARALTAALVDAGAEQVLVAARREEAALEVATMAGAGARHPPGGHERATVGGRRPGGQHDPGGHGGVGAARRLTGTGRVVVVAVPGDRCGVPPADHPAAGGIPAAGPVHVGRRRTARRGVRRGVHLVDGR